MRANFGREIAWGLRSLGEVRSRLTSDGAGMQVEVWIDRATAYSASDGSEFVGVGDDLDSALRAFWQKLTAPGAYVRIAGLKYVYHQGTFQQVME